MRRKETITIWNPDPPRNGITLYVCHVGFYVYADVRRRHDAMRCVRGVAYSVTSLKLLRYEFAQLVTPEFGAVLATATRKTEAVVRAVEELEGMLQAIDGTHLHYRRARRLLSVDAPRDRRYISLR